MISLIIAFFAVSPILLLYTSGYRYDFNSKKIKETGSISIDIEPKDANIYINDILVKQSMPVRLNNRAPGTYKIRIEKEGFKTWEQNVAVESSQTVYIKQNSLLKDRLPEYIEVPSSTPLFLFGSQDQEETFALFKNENGYEFASLKNNDGKGLETIEVYEKEPNISLSSFHKTALIETKEEETKKLELLSLKNATKKTVHTTSIEAPLESQWSKRDGEIYLRQSSIIRKKDIYGLDKVLGNAEARLWYVEYPETIWILKDKVIELLNLSNISYAVPADTMEIIDINQYRIITRGSSGFSVINRMAEEPETTRQIPAEHIYFNATHNEWWVWSDFEFWKITEKGKTELISRYAKKIAHIKPLNAEGLSLLVDESGLNAQNPGYAPTQQLYSSEEVTEVEVSSRDQIIYFIGKLGTKQGLFRLEY